MFIQEYAGISKQRWKLDYHVEYYFLLYIVAEVQSLQNNTDSPKANFQSNIAFKAEVGNGEYGMAKNKERREVYSIILNALWKYQSRKLFDFWRLGK